jgi:hypothetical protein
MMNAMDPLIDQQRETILRIARRHGATRVRVIGSRARGDARPDSDLDLLVDLASGRSLFDLLCLRDEIAEALKLRVDVGQDLDPYIRDAALDDAVTLS